MKKLTILALIAAAAAGTAVAIALTKRKHDAACRYDADNADEYDDECCCDACGVCDICEDNMDVKIPDETPDDAACEADAASDAEDAEKSDVEDEANE
ncbi:MAG: hypothetical protein IKM30_01445 [Oscillospiraceae bacterium]|nr:hypothetical protein [Oscillospiraceae bacterium]